MDSPQIKEVMRGVFGRDFYMHDLGKWVGMRCPLAPWTHEKGYDSSPSAGVSVHPNDTSGFNCFTCKNKGSFAQMLRMYAEFSGDDLDDLIEEIEEGEFLGPTSFESFDAARAANLEHEVAMPIDEGIYMDLYDSAEGHPYLKERGISKRTARKLELLYDPKDPADGMPRILFPVRDVDGLLYGFSGRSTNPKAKLKVRDYAGLAKSLLVLGAHFGPTAKRVVAVEGLVDYATCHEYGEAGMAVMHSNMTPAQAAIFKEVAKPTYLLYDGDKAGVSGADIAEKALVRHMPVLRCGPYPRVKIEDKSEKGWHWLKDPGELLEDEFLDMLDRAVLI